MPIFQKTIAILLIFTLLSCSDSNTLIIPEDVYEETKMITLITDLQIASAAYQNGMLPPVYDGRPDKMIFDFCTAHQTDTATFSRSLAFYARHPETLEKIYTEVEKNLTELKTAPLQ